MWIMTAQGWRMLNTNSIPAPKDRTLLDQMGIRLQPPSAIADAYCLAIDKYLNKEIDYERCMSLKSMACKGQF